MKVIRTLICPDGVIGLNGWMYLLNDDGTTMEFKDTDSANSFLLGEYTQEYIDEWIEIIKKGDK
jgi:hypothetical protein|tara:strand:+ start:581 stop:772 length:192 start_codon:yes stop_codon:yes gene_type:complete